MTNFYPVISSPKPINRGQLTGNPRIVKDLAAEIHSCIQQWNKIHISGVLLLKNITNIKIDETYPNELQEICDNLEKDINKLNEIVINLEIIMKQLKTVVELNYGKEKLFNTWPTEYFADVAHYIYNSYRQELLVKKSIIENIAHDHRDAFKLLHLASWVHQPMIPCDLNQKLESMLIETGHR